MNRIYLDYSATTPLDPRVLETMVLAFGAEFGNASSVHSFGREARTSLEQSRERVASAIGAKPDELFFTSGGTEADNHAIKGLAAAGARRGKNQIITSAVEHHAVLHSIEGLRKSGFDVHVLRVDEFGRVDPAEVRTALSQKTALISIMHANNETGSLNDVREIGSIAHDHGIPFHSDTVQSVGKMKVDVDELNIDVLAISAHKFYGPKGIGAIFVRKGIQIDSFMEGGGQESNRRAGTENVPLAAGFAEALVLSQAEMEKNRSHIGGLKAKLKSMLFDEFKGLLVNGHPTACLPHILNVSFDASVSPMDGDAIIIGLDIRGVAVTSGSACTSGSLQPSHVLMAMGRTEQTARSTIRFSIGNRTTADEIDFAVSALKEVVSKARKS